MNTLTSPLSDGSAPRGHRLLTNAVAGLVAASVFFSGNLAAAPNPSNQELGALRHVELALHGPVSDRGQRPDVRVMIPEPHGAPRFFVGPHNDEFFFVRPAPEVRHIETHDSLRDLLLRPFADAVAWGIGDIATIEVANALGVPIHTTLYAVAPGVPVVSTLPSGYFVAEAVPTNVALITNGVAGPTVLCSRVPPGAFVAYQTSPTGVVLNECVVVPPVQQVVMPMPTTSAPSVVYVQQPATVTAPAPAVATAPAPAAAPSPAASASMPMSSKLGKIVYDANQKPIGVILLNEDGRQEFVPIQAGQ